MKRTWTDLSGNVFSMDGTEFRTLLENLHIPYNWASDATEEVMEDYWPMCSEDEEAALDHAALIGGTAFYFDIEDNFVGISDFEGHWKPRTK